MTDFEPILRDANRRLSAELRAAGRSVWSADIGDRQFEVLDLLVARMAAPASIAEILGADDAVVRDRVYAVDGRRVCWARSYFSWSLAGGTRIALADTGPGGAHARLREIRREPVSFAEDVEFAERENVTSEERDRLDIDDMTAVARVVRRSADASGRVVEVTDMRLVASVYRFRWAWASR